MVLLSGAGNSGPQPVRIRQRCRIDDMDAGGVGNRHRHQNVSNRIERAKALLNDNFEDGGCRIDRAAYRADTLAVPAPAVAKRAFRLVHSRKAVCWGCGRKRSNISSTATAWNRRSLFASSGTTRIPAFVMASAAVFAAA